MSEGFEAQIQSGINFSGSLESKNPSQENPPSRFSRRAFLKALPRMAASVVLPTSIVKGRTEQPSGPYVSREKFRLDAGTLQTLSESLPEGIEVDAGGNVYGLLDFENKLTQNLDVSSGASSEFLFPLNMEALLVRNSWYADALGARRYYGTEYRLLAGNNIAIAVLDTGLFRSNREIEESFPGVVVNFLGDFSPGASGIGNIYDNDTTRTPGGHGTKATTLMAAQIVGLVRPRELKVAKIYDSNGVSNIFNVAEALKTAVTSNVDVIMLNWAFPSDIIQTYFDGPLRMAEREGVVVASAAHNYGRNSPDFPAGFADQYTGLYSVSAIGENLQPSSWTNRPGGLRNAFYLPGTGVYSKDHNNQLSLMSGTSASTPMAAAFAAIAMSEFRKKNPGTTRFQERMGAMQALVDSGRNLEPIDPLGPNAKVPQLQSLYRYLGLNMPTWVKGEVYVPLVRK